MHIFYLTVDRYHQYNPQMPPGPLNPGGGISDKTLAVLKAWRRFYQVGVGEEIDDSADASILVAEPLWFKLRGGIDNDLWTPDIEEAVAKYETHPARLKILYCSEASLLKIPPSHRERIIAASTVVTSNCSFQKGLFAQFGIETAHLCDPIDDSLSIPVKAKTMSVVVAGRISTTKNSGNIIDIFNALKSEPIETVYIGDAGLWGNSAPADKALEMEMRQAVDTYYKSQSYMELLNLLSGYSFALFDSFHDSCSALNLVALLLNIQCFYGRHACWKERRGVHGLESVDDFVNALKKHTTDFTGIPLSAPTDNWVKTNYGLQGFLDNWSELMRKYAT